MYVFTYGLLTNPDYMSGCTGEAAYVTNASFKFNYFANVTAGDSKVHGVLWNVPEEKIQDLDDIEGVPTFYKKIEVAAHTSNGMKEAVMYTMTENTIACSKNTTPSEFYLSQVLTGYKYFNLPISQLLI